VSFVRPLGIALGPLFVLWVFAVIAASSNGVNLADGLDGLACGSAAMVMGAYVVITFWQFRHVCKIDGATGKAVAASVCYMTPHSLDLSIVAASLLGAAAGFLWWNAAPAQIIMGDTGSLAIGAGLASLALLTNTHLLLPVIGGIYVIETVSVILQIASFRMFQRRIFRMAPIHHHFELLGWPETTVIIRFWILAGLATAMAIGIFYADYLSIPGIID
jgi:phospho-N-acetylmuramoyl-pentapeptide-transferase